MAPEAALIEQQPEVNLSVAHADHSALLLLPSSAESISFGRSIRYARRSFDFRFTTKTLRDSHSWLNDSCWGYHTYGLNCYVASTPTGRSDSPFSESKPELGTSDAAGINNLTLCDVCPSTCSVM
jgi:hypothetical protein